MGNKILKTYIQITTFLIYLLIIFGLCRIGFIINSGILNSAITGAYGSASLPFLDIMQTLFSGLRYDGRLAAPAAFIFAVLYIAFSFIKKAQKPVIIVFTSIISYIVIIASFVNDTYFSIFNDTFNIILLGVIYDDQSAIFHTALNSDYNALPKITASIILTAIAVFIYNKIYKKIENINKSVSIKQAVPLGILLLYVLILTTSSTFNLQGGDLSYIVKLPENNFLKKAAPGALHDLDRVYRAYKDIKGESFEKYAGGKTIQQVMQIYFGDKYINQDNISSLMEQEVLYNGKSNAKHIFLIIMESLSDYHLSEEFINGGGIGSELTALANSKDGLKVPVFIQNGYGTIETMDMMITGLYGTYFPVSEMTGKIPCFDSSTGKIFKDLGYDTNFYYFGSSAWRKIGTYTISQGFNKSYGMENIHNKQKSTWGIYDSEGFNFILENLDKNHNKPTFNMILSASNHPPYDIDTKKYYNIDTEKIRIFLDTNYPKEKRFQGITPEILTVTEYSIKSVADFIKKTYAKYPDSIFFVTGDHFDRSYPNPNRKIFTSTSIPLIIYGSGVSEYKLKYTAGSHKDIVPTIAAITAHKGYKFHSFGQSLVTDNKNEKADNERIAIGAQSIANGRYIFNGADIEYFESEEKNENDINTASIFWDKKKAGEAISWYIVNKGYNIPK
ncbi:alkaline phosphatase family protein [uncultured Brachyspira sp.]|uniref:LTA synthase family protein n=1 Tax=uncultured Brachyspira sp. TaxID=221953 RepID=UPI0026358E28|nr:alkaline phosphatase family protein [uncultured Brachyspira sp.]